MKRYYYPILIVSLLIALIVPVASGAVELANPLKAKNFQELVALIANFIFNLALWTAPIMFIIGGFYYLTAAGSPEKIETGKKIILYTIIGLIIIISAKGLINMFKNIFDIEETTNSAP